MTKPDDRIDDLKEVISGIDKRLCDVEKCISRTREEALTSKSELKDLIVEAVSNGNKTIFVEIGQMKMDIAKLKAAEGKKAIYILKTMLITSVTVTIGWIITGFLNNYASITTNAIRNDIQKEVSTNESNNN